MYKTPEEFHPHSLVSQVSRVFQKELSAHIRELEHIPEEYGTGIQVVDGLNGSEILLTLEYHNLKGCYIVTKGTESPEEYVTLLGALVNFTKELTILLWMEPNVH